MGSLVCQRKGRRCQCDAPRAIDGDVSTIWHSQYNPAVGYPHCVRVDMGEATETAVPKDGWSIVEVTS